MRNLKERNIDRSYPAEPPLAGGRVMPLPDVGSAPALSVVIPAYDEADNVVTLVDEIAAVLASGPSYEVVVVDDGSTDGTARRLLERRARGGISLRVLCHARNLGQSAALLSGIRAARAEWVVTLDGDGQNDPADIPRFLDVLRRDDPPGHVRLVCGHRRRRQDGWIKRISSRIANGVRGRVLGDATPDGGCGLKLIHRSTFLDFPFFDHMHRFIPALTKRGGGEVISIDVNHRPRAHGTSKYGVHDRLWSGLVDMLGVLWLRRRTATFAVEELEDDEGRAPR